MTDQALELEIAVEAGRVDRRDALVTVTLDAEDALFARTAGELATVVTLARADGPSTDGVVPCQLAEGGRLTWLLDGELPAGSRRGYRCVVERVPGGRATAGGRPGVTVRLAGDHLWFIQDGRLLARYAYLGNWKPYFWPVMLPEGNVVRGASAEHQHQTGLFLAYGGHGGAGTTNIWSDWDEPPYGPCGKVVHRSFDLVEGGAVYGRFVERVAYTRADGPKLFDEVRDVRVTPLPGGDLLFDLERRPEEPSEEGPKPFILGARVADSMRLVDLTQRDQRSHARPLERPGVLVGAVEPELERPENATHRSAGPWLDWSGPVGEGWAGLAFFDHPANPGHGGGITAGGYGCMTMRHDLPPGAGSALFRYRVVAHRGDAVRARIADRFHDYADPARVTVRAVRRPAQEAQPAH